MTQIIRNAILTPDGTYLHSYNRHDYKTHTDQVSKELYMVDGGNDYLRRSVNNKPAQDLTVTTTDPFVLQRQAFSWGSYGKNGDQPLHYIFLCDMTDAHIRAILETQEQIKGTYVEDLFLQELKYRKDNK